MSKEEDFYDKLALKLKQHSEWPSVYMFKFIVPSDNQSIALVEGLFGSEATVTIRNSSKGNFVSITAKELMLSPKEVVARYQEASSIKGIIAL